MDSGIDEVTSCQEFDFPPKFSAIHGDQLYFIYFYFYFSFSILLLIFIGEDSSKLPKEACIVGYKEGVFYVIGYERDVFYVIQIRKLI